MNETILHKVRDAAYQSFTALAAEGVHPTHLVINDDDRRELDGLSHLMGLPVECSPVIVRGTVQADYRPPTDPLREIHDLSYIDLPQDLGEWWSETARQDWQQAAPKIEEYGGLQQGSADLQIMGNALAELCGMHDAPDAVKQELACWFYALGKISRLVADYKAGKPGKPDTWHDLTVYAMMARRLQETGRWP